jgi:hypothetical protein
MRWRSPAEITFRLRQEARNLMLLARPPKLPADTKACAPLPAPEFAVAALQGTAWAEAVTIWADQIVAHHFPLLGIEIDTGTEIAWRRDYVSGKETGAEYFRSIPYLDASIAGDHKIIWELNRHQHLVLLAQAYLLTERREYLEEIGSQLDSWFDANPMQRGINWASALEVAFRSLSWLWLDHLVGKDLGEARRRRLRTGLYQHAFHLEANLSAYFSPNTHLLGEAVALHALGLMFRGIKAAERWELVGARIVAEEMQRQVRADGSHFEQSSYYHVYALDMFLFHAILRTPDEPYRRGLKNMAVYLEALIGPARVLPLMGDDDGGRLFHPYGRRDHFARATLAANGCFLNRAEWVCSRDNLQDIAIWWLKPEACQQRIDAEIPCGDSVRFKDAGIVVMRSEAAHCIVDAGPFGPFRGGHSHADTLNIVASANRSALLIDPGTYSYSDPRWRNAFRGTAPHNTVRIGGLDQAQPAGPFGWQAPPRVEILEWRTEAAADFLDAACSYRGFRHRRRVFSRKPDLLFVIDEIEGQRIEAEQFWHPGDEVVVDGPGYFRIGQAGALITGSDAELSQGGEFGWRSRAYGAKETAPVIVSRRKGEGVVRFESVLSFSPDLTNANLTVQLSEDGELTMSLDGAVKLAVTFPKTGLPRVQSL